MSDADAPAGEQPADRLERLRARLGDIDEVALDERVALFEQVDRLLSDELDALEDEMG